MPDPSGIQDANEALANAVVSRWATPVAETLVLFQHAGSILPAASFANESVELTGLIGRRDARRAVVRAFRVGSILLMDVAAVIVGRDCDSTPLDGLLPLHLFARVTFNGPEHQLLLETR
jgi:hypothetical protein